MRNAKLWESVLSLSEVSPLIQALIAQHSLEQCASSDAQRQTVGLGIPVNIH